MAGKFTVPDYTEAIIGYRTWRVDQPRDQRPWRLFSPYAHPSNLWEPRRAHKAFCKYPGPRGRHRAARPSCSCGIYALNYSGPLSNPFPHYILNAFPHRMAWGEVALWGRVVICDDGYRAEFAYPKSIMVFLHYASDSAVADINTDLLDYGVPVEFRFAEVVLRVVEPPRVAG
jgi:hypothetical protein